MRNIRIILEYDGTNYHGWQYQKNALTIQEVVKKAIEKITAEKINLIGASRTDTGVHAYYQVANFKSKTKIPAEKIPYAINSLLPRDITVVEAKDVEQDFHSRYSSKGKRYRYVILNRKFSSPIMRNYCWHINYKLDIEKMKEAADFLIGTHDFSAFKASGSNVKNPIRTVKETTLNKNKDIITFEIEADGFLYNMVRIIVGTLVDIGCHKIEPYMIKNILESKNRNLAGKTSPPQGLYLLKIFY